MFKSFFPTKRLLQKLRTLNKNKNHVHASKQSEPTRRNEKKKKKTSLKPIYTAQNPISACSCKKVEPRKEEKKLGANMKGETYTDGAGGDQGKYGSYVNDPTRI